MTARLLTLAALLLGTPAQLAAQLYVPNQDDATVSVIDPVSRRLLRTVDLRRYGLGDNAKPHHVQVEPDGSAWYVTLIGAGKVLKLDRKDQVLGSAEMEVPGLIALHPTKDLMFVARSMSAVNPPPRMVVIRRSDMTVLDEVDLLFPRPHGIVVHPKGDVVYVASLGTNQIASVGVKEGEARLLDVPGSPHGFVQRDLAGREAAGGHGKARRSPPGLRSLPARGPAPGARRRDAGRPLRARLHARRANHLRHRTQCQPCRGGGHAIGRWPSCPRTPAMASRTGSRSRPTARGCSRGTGTRPVVCTITRAVSHRAGNSRRHLRGDRGVDTVLSVGNYAAGLGMTPARSRGSAAGSCS